MPSTTKSTASSASEHVPKNSSKGEPKEQLRRKSSDDHSKPFPVHTYLDSNNNLVNGKKKSTRKGWKVLDIPPPPLPRRYSERRSLKAGPPVTGQAEPSGGDDERKENVDLSNTQVEPTKVPNGDGVNQDGAGQTEGKPAPVRPQVGLTPSGRPRSQWQGRYPGRSSYQNYQHASGGHFAPHENGSQDGDQEQQQATYTGSSHSGQYYFNYYSPDHHYDLKSAIRQQVEYYFSEANLERDMFIRKRMDSEGYLPLSLIASFHRVQCLTQDLMFIIEALQVSTLLELSADRIKVRPRPEPTRWPILSD
ncbi:La-related protein 1 [Halotydeus destructor]|nr:La-related protein 1 [Halotydeus destructor]